MGQLVDTGTGQPANFNLPPDFGLRTAGQQQQILDALISVENELVQKQQITRKSSMEAQLGEPIAGAPTVRGGIAEAELPSIGARFEIGRTAGPRRLDEQTEILRRRFPEMEVRNIIDPSGGQTLAVKMPGGEFALLDSPDAVTLGDVVELGGELISLETMGSIVAALATARKGVVKRAAGQFFGTSAGRAADIAVEMARGLEKDTLKDLGEDIGLRGTLAAAAEGVVAPIIAAGNAVIGRGAIKLTPEEVAAQKTAKDVGMGGLTIGERGGALESTQRQAEITDPVTEAKLLRRQQALLDNTDRVRQAMGGDLTGMSDEVLESGSKLIERDFVEQLGITTPDPAKGGKALFSARDKYLNLQRGERGPDKVRRGGRLSRKYDNAIAASQDAEFNVLDLQADAREVLRGIEGAPLQEGAEGIRLGPNLGGAEPIINDLLALDPIVRPFNDATGFQQLKEIRTRLFDLKNARIPGQEDPGNRIAGILYDKITQVMENPIGGDDQFVNLMRAANFANFRHEKLLELSSVMEIAQAAKKGQPEKLVRNIAQPGNGSQLRTMARVFNPEDWADFQQSFKNDLLSEPERIGARLDAFRQDPRALRMLVGEGEESAIRLIGDKVTQFRSGPFQAALKRHTDVGERALSIARDADPTEIAKFLSKVGGKEGPTGRDLRAATITSILDAGKTTKKGINILRPNRAFVLIERLEKTGKLDAIFLADEAALLRRKRDMLSFMLSTTDTGASIQKGEIGKNLAEAARIPISGAPAAWNFWRGISAVVRNKVAGYVLTSPTARAAMLGVGQKPLDLTTLRMLAVVTSTTAADIEEKP